MLALRVPVGSNSHHFCAHGMFRSIDSLPLHVRLSGTTLRVCAHLAPTPKARQHTRPASLNHAPRRENDSSQSSVQLAVRPHYMPVLVITEASVVWTDAQTSAATADTTRRRAFLRVACSYAGFVFEDTRFRLRTAAAFHKYTAALALV